jgi:hypothetical protein
MELSITICLNKPIVGPTLIYIAAILFIYSYYKEAIISKKVALVVFLIVSVPYVYHMQNEWPCENPFGVDSTTLIRGQLGTAYANMGTVQKSTERGRFYENQTLKAEEFEWRLGAARLSFECSSNLQSFCLIQENGAKLTIVEHGFAVHISACCVDTYTEPKCVVKLGEETLRC